MDVDIEDAVPAGPPPGFRVPIRAVNIQPRKANHKHNPNHMMHIPSSSVPGTQAIYVKTFGCSHNQSDSEYMTGQLSAYGYGISDNPDEADLWLINTCTVKSPSQSAMETIIRKGKSLKKPLVVAGCVPQGSRDMKELEGISLIGVQQIDNIVHVVEESLKGHEVRLLRRNTLPALDLPKVRKNKFIEILPINVGCLGACTYCKTKHARGHLGSYKLEALVERAKTVIAEGVKEIWLSSEDTGAYGRDIGLTLPTLLKALVAVLPSDRSTMLRIGMTNPPYILEDLEEIAEILHHPCVYSFLHVPVQSGSDSVLNAMKREYTVSEFKRVVDTLMLRVPGIQIATDIICGFPGETNEDFEKTIKLIEGYKFAQVHISQFYPRPGTPAARMKKVPTSEVKKRSRMLTSIFESFTPYAGMEGQTQRIWIADAATDGIHLVGHTKSYVQVLIRAPVTLLGRSVDVKITSVGRWSVFGDIISMPYCQENSHETTADTNAHEVQFNEQTACSVSCSCVSTGNSGKQCMCLKQEEYSCCDLPKSCCCHAESVDRKADFDTKKNIDVSMKDEKHLYCSSQVFGTVLKKSVSSFLSMRNRIHKDTQTEANELHQIVSPKSHHRVEGFSVVDWVLLGGIALSFVIFVLLILQF